MSPVEWAKRINRSWIVHNNLNDQAEAWINHLADTRDPRLEISCEAARAMCDRREPLDDPKPWFYAGLFHLATPDEAHRFLDLHRVTKATVSSMADDENVRLWINRISPETRELLERLRFSLREIGN
ncbi:hypothetical protein JIN84_17100 [Luteolibacter yonseiensis]|uniref:Uncharacterized protein n=1 Tax=Luteolibacter yonseiensis TaxID=1144680 RepID=A0A934VCU5_9BACT|nr:hypothetical protein [Luteolibacter yonseiensis]MBK1817341.1 hypothetical protein [Luteolibacter yonseiensis]